MGERARPGGPALVAAAAAAALLTLPASATSSAPTTRVSVATGGAPANGNSLAPAISKDGRFVAFYSDASNLVPGDANGESDVFVYDRSSGTTTLASASSSGVQGDAPSGQPALDADGGVVAFSSFADNLIALDENFTSDIFVRERQTGTTTR